MVRGVEIGDEVEMRYGILGSVWLRAWRGARECEDWRLRTED